uniref:Uncharacterized protein n=2 Tax=Anguilla anguilla TaxID=7936 RepID=A0A0E9XXA8_ANGAN
MSLNRIDTMDVYWFGYFTEVKLSQERERGTNMGHTQCHSSVQPYIVLFPEYLMFIKTNSSILFQSL